MLLFNVRMNEEAVFVPEGKLSNIKHHSVSVSLNQPVTVSVRITNVQLVLSADGHAI